MSQMKTDLIDPVLELDREFGDLKLAARQRLGQLFNTSDYPSSLSGLFDVVWDYPSGVTPPAQPARLFAVRNAEAS